MLIDLYPAFYGDSPEFAAWQRAMDVQVQAALDSQDDLYDQLMVETATWSLSLWEKEVGLDTDLARNTDQRRERVLGKLRSLPESMTPARLEEMLEAFGKWGVAIEEKIGEYAIVIRFTDAYGTPTYMDSVDQAVREAIPAHIAYSFAFLYPVWRDIDALRLMWDTIDAAAQTWDEIDEGGWFGNA